jgi:hypothetical protein
METHSEGRIPAGGGPPAPVEKIPRSLDGAEAGLVPRALPRNDISRRLTFHPTWCAQRRMTQEVTDPFPGSGITWPGSTSGYRVSRGSVCNRATATASRRDGASCGNEANHVRRSRRAKARRIADPGLDPLGLSSRARQRRKRPGPRATDHPTASFWHPARDGRRRFAHELHALDLLPRTGSTTRTRSRWVSTRSASAVEDGHQGASMEHGLDWADLPMADAAARHRRCASPWLDVTAVRANHGPGRKHPERWDDDVLAIGRP